MSNPLIRAKLRSTISSFLVNEWPGLLVSIMALIAYIVLTPDYVLGGDNGEFAALSRTDGIAHPPGYPLYTLYLRMTSWIPGSGAKSSALATAMLGGLQILALYVACRKWAIGAVASSIAVAFYASSPLALTLNTQAEVFCLNNLIAAGLLLVAAPCTGLRPQCRIPAAGLILGLGFSNHHTIVFLLPLVLASMVMSLKQLKTRQIAFYSAFFLSAFLIGLLPNLLLVYWSNLRVENYNSWSNISSLETLVHHFLRRDYGTFDLSAGKSVVDVKAHQRLLAQSLYWSWSLMLLPACIGYVSVIYKFWQRPSRLTILWSALALSTLISGPLFVTRFNIFIAPPGLAIFERFYFLPSLLLAIPVASGLDRIGDYSRLLCGGSGVGPATASLARSIDGAIVACLILFSFYFNGSIARSVYSDRIGRLVHDSLLSALSSVPEDAIVFVSADHRVFGFLYLSLSERIRPDVTIIAPSVLRYQWYRERYGLRAKNSSEAMALLLRRSFLSRRAVLVDAGVFPMLKGFKSYQFGHFRRVLSAGEPVPNPQRLLHLNHALFRDMLRSRRALSGDGWGRVVEDEMANAWVSLAKDLRSKGRADLATEAFRMSRVLGPCVKLPCPTSPAR